MKVFVITGASSGIGRSVAIQAAQAGNSVVVHYGSNKAGADETAALCTEAGAPDVCVMQLDLEAATSASVAAFVDAVVAHFGRIDVLVNNAGVFTELEAGEGKSLAEFEAFWQKIVNTNLNASALLSYAVGQQMIKQVGDIPPATVKAGTAAIINVGSRGAFRGEPTSWAYGASKAGLHALGQCMARSLGRWGIVCTSVAPGFVETPMAVYELEGPTGAATKAQSPFNRVATPEEVADVVMFLSRYETNPWVTGGVIDCNGASYLRT